MAFKTVHYGIIEETPIDHLWVAMAPAGLVAIQFRGEESEFRRYVERLTGVEPERNQLKVLPAISQVSAYLTGERKQFTLPICWRVMTKFQKKVLGLVSQIPYGRLRTYNDIAHELNDPKAIRAVGRANATNPIPLVIPCHRVIGSDGSLRGFGGGLETKAQLLRMEGSWLL